MQQFEVRDLELNPGENEFAFVAESQFGRQTKLTLIVSRTAAQEGGQTNGESTPTDTGTVAETPVTKMDLTITIVQDIANVRVVADGKTQINQVLQPGTSRSFSASQTFIIQTPRPAFVKIKINNKDYEITTTDEHEWKLTDGVVKQIR